MTALIILTVLFVLAAWLLRRTGRARISPALSGRILYTDTERNTHLLTSERFHLTGKPDYILKDHGEVIPVERKSRELTAREPHDSERLQLAAYCLLVEEHYGQPVRRGRLQYPNGSIDVPFDADLRTKLLSTLREIQQRRTSRDVRRSHESPARCRGCGFRERCPDALA